jgi:choline monooxygenase
MPGMAQSAAAMPDPHGLDAALARVRRRRLFPDGWSCIGFAGQVPGPGDAVPVDHPGAPLLMLRA